MFNTLLIIHTTFLNLVLYTYISLYLCNNIISSTNRYSFNILYCFHTDYLLFFFLLIFFYFTAHLLFMSVLRSREFHCMQTVACSVIFVSKHCTTVVLDYKSCKLAQVELFKALKGSVGFVVTAVAHGCRGLCLVVDPSLV